MISPGTLNYSGSSEFCFASVAFSRNTGEGGPAPVPETAGGPTKALASWCERKRHAEILPALVFASHF